MLNISHLYKLLLSKDIEININSKIENIKNENKWSDLNVKSVCDKIDFTTLGINDIKYHAALLEDISKLSVDLLLDYDYYKKFIFKGEFRSVDYDEKLRMLGYEIEDDYWHNVKKPSKDTVIMNVFLSCLYNGLVEIMDDKKTKFDSKDRFDNVLVEDQDLKLENNSIIESGTSKEMKNSTTINNELIIQVNKWKCWKTDCNGLNDDKSKFCHKCGLQRTPPVTFSDLIERNVEDKIIKLWICEKCWQYNIDNSKFCTRKQCSKPRYKQTSKIIDKIYMKTDDIDLNVWICRQCTLQNPKESYKCSCCGSIGFTEWKCWFVNCRQSNDNQYEFCQTCKLERFANRKRGALVKCEDKDGIKEVWICQKCFKYNSLSNEVCSGKNCCNPRF